MNNNDQNENGFEKLTWSKVDDEKRGDEWNKNNIEDKKLMIAWSAILIEMNNDWVGWLERKTS